MDFDRKWTIFALEEEYDYFGMERIAEAHNKESECPDCHGDKHLANIARRMGHRPDVAFARIRQLERAMQTFVARCEEGSIRSKKTYAQFKELLTT